MRTEFLTRSDLAAAADILRRGGVVAVPTETVYGLAANGLDETAVGKVFAAKGRPENKPVSLFVTDIAQAGRFCHVTDAARALAVLWPGPLTVVLRAGADVPAAVTAGGGSVGVRVPGGGTALEILRRLDFPLTGTSANLSGRRPAVTGAEAMAVFAGRVDAVVDGACPGGAPSTVVDLTGDRAKIVRLGAIARKTLEALLGEAVE